MTYTVWMDGTRIGETAFELRHGTDRHGGVFHPTELGLAMLPGITAMGPALLDAGRMCRERGIDTEDPDLDVESATQTVFETPEGDRVLAAARLIARLELHGPSGELVRWESILISDLNDLAAAAERSSSAEDPATIDRRDRPPVRYFISAKFSAGRRGIFRRSRGQSVS
jgi:hypothetical protein